MKVTASTMRVEHIFKVVQQEEVAAVVRLGDVCPVYPVFRLCVDGRPNPKTRTYLNLWGGVWIVLLYLVTPPYLCLGLGGVAFHLGCRCQAACC